MKSGLSWKSVTIINCRKMSMKLHSVAGLFHYWNYLEPMKKNDRIGNPGYRGALQQSNFFLEPMLSTGSNCSPLPTFWKCAEAFMDVSLNPQKVEHFQKIAQSYQTWPHMKCFRGEAKTSFRLLSAVDLLKMLRHPQGHRIDSKSLGKSECVPKNSKIKNKNGLVIKCGCK